MKKILVILLLLITMSGYSQSWNTTRHTDLYKSILINIEVGYEYGLGLDSISRTVTDFSLIITPDNFFGFGAGFGLRYYPDIEQVLLPIYVEIRGYPFTYRKLWLPYVAVKLGHSFELTDNFHPTGFMATPSVGIMYENRNNKFYSIAISYSIQSIEQPRPPNENYNGIGLSLGYSF